ncbi:energy transducer TonB [Tamlana sp. I1]|uniref:energy transducer TonB n=1 Tax=Tamlana sp. I1 TaxID=2762061 RepID=UPI00188EC3DC|nr:energy transducer TonB [Tamlana sp. I1]
MKHLLLFCLISFNVYAQSTQEKFFRNKYEEFDYYAKPNKNNSLSEYFRNHINTKLLEAVKFPANDAYKKRIFLTFKFDFNNAVREVEVNSPYSELNEGIKKAFMKYNISNLHIPEKNSLNIYVLQIISKEGDHAIINCSSKVVYDRYPVFEGCESIPTYSRMKRCNDKQLERYVVKYISPKEIMDAKVIGTLKLQPKFLVDKAGDIKNIKSKAPTEGLAAELNRVLALMPRVKYPPTRNGLPTNMTYNGKVVLQIEGVSDEYEKEIESSNDSIYSPNSDLALHFKKFLTEKDLKSVVFYKNNKDVSISFSVDKKGKLVHFKANSKDQNFNDKLIKIFKKFPAEKLNIKSTSVLELFRFNVITKGYTKNSIECNENPMVLISPIFSEKCAKSKNPAELRKCMSVKISKIVEKRFDTSLAQETKLTGNIKIYCIFKVDTKGKIVDVRVRAPNPFLANEAEEILNSIPNLYKPGYLNGKPVTVPFSLPINFSIKKPEIGEPFKTSNKVTK